MEKITIHAALAELKKLDQRIRRKIKETSFVGCVKGINPSQNVYRTSFNKSDYAKNVLAAKDSLIDLIERRNKIKKAVTISNATTSLTVGKTTMTVAEAIEMKTAIEYKIFLRDTIKNQYKTVLALIEETDRDVQDEFSRIMSEDSKLNKDTNKVFEAFKEDRVFNLVDPIKANDFINELSEEIEDFNSNIDSALSISNAITYIEI